MTAVADCGACDAGLPLVWCVQSRKRVHLRGLETITCARVTAREQRAKDIANDRGNEDQRGR
jgi:thiol-disulfide isomerase/thioredoxin